MLRRPRPMRGSQAAYGFVSLGLALVLIFPVISITDDLETLQLPMVGPASPKVVKYTTSHLSPASPKIRHVPIAFGAFGFMISWHRCFGYILPALLDTGVSRLLSSFEIRGPPSC